MKKRNKPKLTIFDIYFREPIKKFAGIENSDGGVGKITKYSKNIEREISNTDMQKRAYIREQTKIITEAIRGGTNTYHDFEYALKKVKIMFLDENNNEVQFDGYQYQTYLNNLVKYNLDNIEKINKISENDYDSVTRLQEAIDQLKEKHETMFYEKSRIDRTVEKYNKRNK